MSTENEQFENFPEEIPDMQCSDKGGVVSASVSETNRIRALLGLAPLIETDESEDVKAKDEQRKEAQKQEFSRRAALELHEKLQKQRAEARLKRAKTSGDSLGQQLLKKDHNSAASWVNKSRTLAATSMEDEQDEQDMDQTSRKRSKAGGPIGLEGKLVRHDLSQFAVGETKILTLKDKPILDTRGEVLDEVDELVNVELIESDKLERSKARKQKRPIYDPYGDNHNALLAQYDDEVTERSGFALDAKGNASVAQSLRQITVQDQMSAKTVKTYDLMDGKPLFTTDYYTEEELNTKFKKKKRKKKNKRSKPMIDATTAVNGHSTTDSGSRKRKKDDALGNDDTSSLDSGSRKRRRLVNGEASKKDAPIELIEERRREDLEKKFRGESDKYAFLGDADFSESTDRKKRDQISAALRSELETDEEILEKQRRYQLAVERANRAMKANLDKIAEANALFMDSDDDNEFYQSLKRVDKMAQSSQIVNNEEKSVALIVETVRLCEEDKKKQQQSKRATNPKADENDEELVFTTASQFSHGLRDAVGELEDEQAELQARARRGGLRYATDMDLDVPEGEDAPALIDAETGRQISVAAVKQQITNTRHQLDHLLPLRESENVTSGGWVDTSENKKSKNNTKYSSSGDSSRDYVAAEDVILDKEPLVARSLVDTLAHIRRRGFMVDEEFEEQSGGKTDKFRPIDIEKKGSKGHLEWDINQVMKWLREIGLTKYQSIFKKKAVGGLELDSLNTEFCCRVLTMDDKDCGHLLQELGNLKGDPAPDIRLPYLDTEGRPMSAKEAFRQLSHKFHGKKPGKKKQEKRLRRKEEDTVRKKRRGVDTPLGTLSALKETTQMTGRPFVVLEGKDNASKLTRK